MNPWGQAVFDTLGALVSQDVVEEVLDRGMLEVLPLTHIRGRSLHDAFVIVDEAQSLERNVLLTVLSRIGQNSRVVLTHDVAQRDNLRVGRHDGVAAVIETLKGHPLFAHVTLTRSERRRSPRSSPRCWRASSPDSRGQKQRNGYNRDDDGHGTSLSRLRLVTLGDEANSVREHLLVPLHMQPQVHSATVTFVTSIYKR